MKIIFYDKHGWPMEKPKKNSWFLEYLIIILFHTDIYKTLRVWTHKYRKRWKERKRNKQIKSLNKLLQWLNKNK